MIESTLIGGSGQEYVFAIDRDANGGVVIGGSTTSWDFPTTLGVIQPMANASLEGFVMRFTPAGNALVYSTFLGGAFIDQVKHVCCTGSGDVTVGGWTWSNDFPTTPGVVQSSNAGSSTADVFVAGIDASGQRLLFSTYLGGTERDELYDMEVDSLGSVTLVGTTGSTNFPVTMGALQTRFTGPPGNAQGCGFITRLSARARTLEFSTFLGGGNQDVVTAAELHEDRSVTVAGHTQSMNFPTTAGAFLPNKPSASLFSGFVTRIDPNGSALQFSTFLGGLGTTWHLALALDAAGAPLVTGWTIDHTFPTTLGAYERGACADAPLGRGDAFVTRFDRNGSKITYSSYLGAAGLDQGTGIASRPDGSVVVSGVTAADNFPTTPGAAFTNHSGGHDGFVACLDLLPIGVERYGNSLPACAGPIVIDVTELPTSSSSNFAITSRRAPPRGAGLLLLGVGRQTAGPILVDLQQTHVALPIRADAFGYVEVTVPTTNVMPGAVLYAQTVWGPTAGCPFPTPFASSSGLSITVQ